MGNLMTVLPRLPVLHVSYTDRTSKTDFASQKRVVIRMRNLGGGICERFPGARRHSSSQVYFTGVLNRTHIFPYFLQPKFFLLLFFFKLRHLFPLSKLLHTTSLPRSIADRKDNTTPFPPSEHFTQISLYSIGSKNFCRGSPQKQVYEYRTTTSCKRKLPNTTIDLSDYIQFTKATVFFSFTILQFTLRVHSTQQTNLST